jgi:GNAT superfamily N-acetyltransferase
MTVRFAIAADLPDLVELVRQAHLESRFAWMTFNARQTWRFLEGRLPRKDCCFLVANIDGECVGGLLADTQTHWFSGTKFVSLRALYIAPSHRGGVHAAKMLHGLRQWAGLGHAAELRIDETFLAPDPKLGRLLGKMGYQSTGTVWSTWVNA